MDLKKTDAPVTTVTYNRNQVDAPTDNIYEAISVIAKRAEQINTDIRRELIDKLEEFARAETKDNGKPISLSRSIDIPRAASNFSFFAKTMHHHTHAQNEDWLPSKEVAKLHDLVPDYVSRLARQGKVNGKKVDGVDIF